MLLRWCWLLRRCHRLGACCYCSTRRRNRRRGDFGLRGCRRRGYSRRGRWRRSLQKRRKLRFLENKPNIKTITIMKSFLLRIAKGQIGASDRAAGLRESEPARRSSLRRLRSAAAAVRSRSTRPRDGTGSESREYDRLSQTRRIRRERAEYSCQPPYLICLPSVLACALALHEAQLHHHQKAPENMYFRK